MSDELTNPYEDSPAPGGFHVPTYLRAIKNSFEEKFQPEGETQIFKSIIFSESKDFEALDMNLPGIILDLEGAKMNPAQGEFQHAETSIYSNLGQLELYAYVKATIIVSNRSIDPHTCVRRLAFDVAGFRNRVK